MRTSDAESVLRALFLQGLDGDAVAYRRFLGALSAHLRAYLGKHLFGWPDEVEDLVQECLLAMHNQRHTYQPQMPVTAWVHAIARYKLVDWLRSHAVKEARNDPLDDAASGTYTRAAVQGPPRRTGCVPLPEWRSHSREGGRREAPQGDVLL